MGPINTWESGFGHVIPSFLVEGQAACLRAMPMGQGLLLATSLVGPYRLIPVKHDIDDQTYSCILASFMFNVWLTDIHFDCVLVTDTFFHRSVQGVMTAPLLVRNVRQCFQSHDQLPLASSFRVMWEIGKHPHGSTQWAILVLIQVHLCCRDMRVPHAKSAPKRWRRSSIWSHKISIGKNRVVYSSA